MTYVIAELGINHDGEYKKALSLIKGASEAGVNAVKFQYRNLNRSYQVNSNQISDEMIKSEIKKNFLSVSKIIKLCKFAKKNNLDTGISFFTKEDYYDFLEHKYFDFYKVPSVEFTNNELITKLLKSKKKVYISLGCQTELIIKNAIKRYSKFKNYNLLHCVSNYPLAPHNSNLGYIKYFQDKYKMPIGYSSHDSDWKMIILAIAYGASVIERHITLGNRKGLDETTSSTIKEFKEIVKTIHNCEKAKGGYHSRKPNQGEILNYQNLGRSYYLKASFRKGTILKKTELNYMSPATGLSSKDIDKYIEIPIIKDVKRGEVLTSAFYKKSRIIGSAEQKFCNKYKISLPIRTYDAEKMRSEFKIKRYEFHLSYTEIDKNLRDIDIHRDHEYSIHLPDYISPITLIDPFDSGEIGRRSRYILNTTFDLSKKIQKITGKTCPVIGSFSVINSTKDIFYKKIYKLCKKYKKKKITLLPQWLPPIAWYFGGSFPLNVFNSSEDIDYLKKYNISICFDSSHFIMCLNGGQVNANKDLNNLIKLSSHIHISGAEGLDGEGTSFKSKKKYNNLILKKCLKVNCIKVIETWQGHLNNYTRFHKSIFDITKYKL